MPREHDEGVKLSIGRMVRDGVPFSAISEQLDVSVSTVSKYQNYGADDPAGGETREYEESGDGASVRIEGTPRPVKTLADAIRAAEVDTTVWYVDKWGCRAWNMGMKVGTKASGFTPRVVQLYSVWVNLKRLVPAAVKQADDAYHARMREVAPDYSGFQPLPPVKGRETMAVVGLFDAHFGKLCWHRETGTDYDLKIADAVFRNAGDDLIRRMAGRNVTRIVLPVGNDFFHIDGLKNTTTAGTPQDVDGRYWKVIDVGTQAYLDLVEKLMRVAVVDVPWVAGNHDSVSSGHVARRIASHFHRTDRVRVDTSVFARKYLRWKSTLLGLTHGDKGKPADLPNKMATERPAEWARTTCREWVVGHMHRSRKWVSQGTDTFDGTTVRVLQSLAGTDAWHYEQGYINTRRAAEVLYYDHADGYCGHDVVPARAG